MTSRVEPGRWQEIQAAFDAVVELQRAERDDKLALLRSADPEVCAAVEALLAADADVDARLARLEDSLAPHPPPNRVLDPLQLTGRVVSHFRVREAIGAGGMGVVYHAEDTRLGRDVALKFLLPSHSLDDSARQRFLREAHAAAALDHPNLCAIHEIGETDDGRPFLAIPFYPGETLKARLARKQPVSMRESLEIARQIAAGLESAHARGIVHRDLKPGNIMLLPGGVVKILDFGLAKARHQSLTDTGDRFGTVSYMAPEQVRGGPVDRRADLWALGVVLYEMRNGRKPFDGEEEIAVAHAILHDDVPPFSAGHDDVSLALEDLVRKLLHKSPGRRHASASEVLRDLARVQVAPGLAWSLRARGQRAWRQRLPWRRSVIATAALILLVAGALGHGAITGKETPERILAPATSIAVLPFRNLTAPGSWVYFAGGLQDAILTQLYSVPGIKAIGRTTLTRYAGLDTPPLRQIASELGAGSIVRGSVSDGPRGLRVDVELIDAATGARRWAQSYDRYVRDAFAVQSDIVLQILAAVGAQLGDSLRLRLTQPPASGDVYPDYLAGREYLRAGNIEWQQLDIAQLYLDRAIQFDSNFALALAARAELYAWRQLLSAPPFPEHGPLQRKDAEAALRLAPTMPQAHFAMGVAHLIGDRRDAAAALAEFTIAQQGLPNDADVWAEIAESRRILGDWRGAVAAFDRALDLDPLNRGLLQSLGLTLTYMRRYADAVRAFDRAALLAAAEPASLNTIALEKARTYVLWRGELDSLRTAADRISWDAERRFVPALDYLQMLLWQRRTDSLLAVLGSARILLLQNSTHFWPAALVSAWTHRLRGDTAAARREFEAALALVQQLIVVQREPDNAGRLHAARGLALAGLGRTQEALEDARWLQRSAPLRNDATVDPLLRESMARIYAQLGEADRALDQIQRLLARPSLLSVHSLRLDPVWDPVRDSPRFRALLAQ